MDSTIDLTNDLARLALQEEQLQFDVFTNDTAWQLGMRLKDAVEARGKAVAIDIQFTGQPLFFFAMPGTTPDNVDWIRRKRNVVLHYHRSSYAIGLELKKNQTTLLDKAGLAVRDYAPHGGCFPIWIRGSGFVGTITISGLPQREDHNVIVEVLATWLNCPLSELALSDTN
ncbi:heme-degrading domain-containing protein [Spirosoma arboris]|uniref:heme-degrading domain-containing protein n=1 Tax=Spirosoma arboris TaxID=2682092 RepID=UPI0012F80308|nr:heme-degrading domain-containing protein [Spirosoma arboris]